MSKPVMYSSAEVSKQLCEIEKNYSQHLTLELREILLQFGNFFLEIIADDDFLQIPQCQGLNFQSAISSELWDKILSLMYRLLEYEDEFSTVETPGKDEVSELARAILINLPVDDPENIYLRQRIITEFKDKTTLDKRKELYSYVITRAAIDWINPVFLNLLEEVIQHLSNEKIKNILWDGISRSNLPVNNQSLISKLTCCIEDKRDIIGLRGSLRTLINNPEILKELFSRIQEHLIDITENAIDYEVLNIAISVVLNSNFIEQFPDNILKRMCSKWINEGSGLPCLWAVRLLEQKKYHLESNGDNKYAEFLLSLAFERADLGSELALGLIENIWHQKMSKMDCITQLLHSCFDSKKSLCALKLLNNFPDWYSHQLISNKSWSKKFCDNFRQWIRNLAKTDHDYELVICWLPILSRIPSIWNDVYKNVFQGYGKQSQIVCSLSNIKSDKANIFLNKLKIFDNLMGEHIEKMWKNCVKDHKNP